MHLQFIHVNHQIQKWNEIGTGTCFSIENWGSLAPSSPFQFASGMNVIIPMVHALHYCNSMI